MNNELRPYSDYKDSGLRWLGAVPAHWNVLRCKYLFREIDERSATGEETHLSMSQKLGLIASDGLEGKRLQSESYAGAKLCRKDDLVLNRLKAHLGVFSRAKQAGVVSPDYTVLRPQHGDDVTYFEYVFKTPACIAELRRSTKGIVEGFWRLYTDDFFNIRVPVPPVDERSAILRFVATQDTRIRKFIRNRRQLIEVLNEQKQGIINKAVTRGLDANIQHKSSGIDWIGAVPEHWERRRLKFLATIIYGSSPHNSTYNDEGRGVLLINGPDEYSKEDFGFTRALKWTTAPVKFAPAGSLLFCLRGSTTGRLNICHADVSIGRGVAALVPHGNERYFTYAMMALRAHLESTFRGSTFPSVTSEHVNNYWLPDPPVASQEQIADWIDSETKLLNDVVSRVHREIDLILEYRTRLIADVVTGKLDVRHLAPPPGSIELDEVPTIDAEEALDEELDGEDESDLVEEAVNADD
jgi:type I restriction enzyme S subunit